jgi:hypothetical protein
VAWISSCCHILHWSHSLGIVDWSRMALDNWTDCLLPM